MKRFLLCIGIMLSAATAYADSKLTAISTDTTPSLSDVLYEVKTPTSTPTSKQVLIGSVLGVGTTFYIHNQSNLQSGSAFYVSSGAVQGPFRVIQSDDDSGSGPMIISSTFTKLLASDRYHSAYFYGIVPDPTTNNGEFVITMSSQTPFKPDQFPDYSLRPEIAMQQNNGATGPSYIALRADSTINLPNNTVPGTFVVLPSTSVNYGQLEVISQAATQNPFLVRGAASQSSQLTQWQNSSAVIVSSVGADGNFYTSTMTVKAIRWNDGTIQVSSPTAGGGGGSFINNQNTLQSGSTFYVSSGTVQGQLSVGSNSITPSFIAVGSAEDSNSILNVTNNYSTAGHYLGFFKALAPNMPAGTSFGYYFTWGVGDSNYDRAFVNYNYVGHNNVLNSVDFGFFGIASVFSYFANNRVGIGTGSGVDPGATLHISPDVSTTKPLIIQGASSQSANLQQWQNSSGVVLSSVASNGNITASTITAINSVLSNYFTGGSFPGNYPLRLDMAANPVGPAAQFIFPDTSQFNITEAGLLGTTDLFFQFVPIDPTGYGYLETHSGGGFAIGTDNSTNVLIRPNRVTTATFNPTGETNISINSSSAKGLTVKAASSQSANLQEWQDSSATPITVIDENGNLGLGNSNPQFQMDITANTAPFFLHFYDPFTVAGGNDYGGMKFDTPTQTVGYFIFTGDSFPSTQIFQPDTFLFEGLGTGGMAFEMRPDVSGTNGDMYFGTGATYASQRMRLVTATGLVGIGAVGSATLGSQLHVISAASTNIGAIVQGASSQSVDLQEWRNSSSVVLSSVAANGDATFPKMNASTITVRGTNIFVTTQSVTSYYGYALYVATGVVNANTSVTISTTSLGTSSLGLPICSEVETTNTASVSVRVKSLSGLPNSFTVYNADAINNKDYICYVTGKPL